MNDFPNIDQYSFSYNDVIGQRRENAPRTNPRVVTSSANVNALDDLISVDATSGAVTMTLETAVGCDGRRHLFKKSDASGNAVTIACTGGQTIDGAATATLATQYSTLAVISNGTNWFAFAGYPITGVKQVTVDFGSRPVSEALFTVTDASVGSASKIIAQIASVSAGDRDLDEIQSESLYVFANPSTLGEGLLDFWVRTIDGSTVSEKFVINYQVGV
jgi:hypothetical protein